ncbi:MAG: chemotaxis protein CheA [Deltaproteobacteria bacterium]|nr:chemotaxis protein CheA [Deltaproteobacteria bacterium]
MDEVIQEFVVESCEGLDRVDRDLVRLEQDPHDEGVLRAIFRTVHTLKGTCGFLGFSQLHALAHAAENLLSRLRDRRVQMRPEIATALLQFVDACRRALIVIEQTGKEEDVLDVEALMVSLRQLSDPAAEPQVPTPRSPEPPAPSVSQAEMRPSALPPAETSPPAPLSAPSAPSASSASSASSAPSAPSAPAPTFPPAPTPVPPNIEPHLSAVALSQDVKAQRASPSTAAPGLDALPSAGGVESDSNGVGTESDVGSEAEVRSERAAGERAEWTSTLVDTSIRVNVPLLDKVMNLVGELVLARNQAMQSTSYQSDPIMQRLGRITTELQESVVQMRMQPIASLWGSFPRVARDLAHSCNKKVQLRMEGNETELDRSLLEAIKDPLVHLLRNAIDHGIETKEVRAAAGKSEVGMVILRAYHEEGEVAIEVTDDGAGIEAARLRATAVGKHLLSRAEAEVLSESEALNLIFLPGFSTAAKVTSVSGRGVGMDVVKTNIENIGGSIEIRSEPRKGTTIRIRIPLTLAIIPALIVRSQTERFAIPQSALVELIRLDAERAVTVVEHVQGVPLYRLRGRILPLVYLDEQLGLCSERTSEERIERDGITIVVLQINDQPFGLVVDEIFDTEEIVVKPLGRELRGLRTYAGATIMGDGRVGLILDASGLAEHARVVAAHDRVATTDAQAEVVGSASTEALLLFTGPDDARMAIPAATVLRLENVSPNTIERVGGQSMVQYRDTILPIVMLEDVLPERRAEPRTGVSLVPADGLLRVVVCDVGGLSFGIVVCNILDITTVDSSVRRAGGRVGVMATIVVDGRVTELLDLDRFAAEVRAPRGFSSEVRHEL